MTNDVAGASLIFPALIPLSVTYFYLIRHGTNDWLSHSIAGWRPEVHLNDEGRRQAEQLARRLAGAGIQRIYSSPLERARETAAPLGRAIGVEVQLVEDIGEVRFGDWTGKRLVELEQDPRWHRWNLCRSNNRAPNGETLLEVQSRVVGFLQRLCDECPGETVALFSHGDPIRAVLLYYLGVSLDFVNRLEISPASSSVVALDPSSAQILSVNRLDYPLQPDTGPPLEAVRD